jgi:hypothetical protein
VYCDNGIPAEGAEGLEGGPGRRAERNSRPSFATLEPEGARRALTIQATSAGGLVAF